MLTVSHPLFKMFCLVTAVFFASALNVQTPKAQRAASLSDEPHYRLIFENSYARVFRMSLAAHDTTLLHQHDRPYVYVSLGPADFVDAVASKPDVQVLRSSSSP